MLLRRILILDAINKKTNMFMLSKTILEKLEKFNRPVAFMRMTRICSKNCIILTLKIIRWFLWDFSGVHAIWLKVAPPPKRKTDHSDYAPPATIGIWLISIYFAIFSFSITRYGVYFDRAENKFNTMTTLLVAGIPFDSKKIKDVAGFKLPVKPEIKWEDGKFLLSVLDSFFKNSSFAQEYYGQNLNHKGNIDGKSESDLFLLLTAEQWKHTLENANLSSADFSYANFSKANLASADLSNANLESANLAGANLSKANLASADLSNANLESANLAGANLTKANLALADLSNANLAGVNFSAANFAGAMLTNTDLEGACLVGANFSGADLGCVNLKAANLSHANFGSANLNHAFLNFANLSGVDFSRATLTNANLTSSNLTNANLKHADLFNSRIESANLTGAKLFAAGLEGAYLNHANLTDADFSYAELFNTDLKEANLEGAVFEGACYTGRKLSNEEKEYLVNRGNGEVLNISNVGPGRKKGDDL